ncbi:MAG: hypothetical protein JEZ10_02075 [Verrucomicrobia bacterium]|nr:hypothetical protein [Verrucomicrobiota bacterium]
MNIEQTDKQVVVKGDCYTLTYDAERPLHVKIMYSNGVGAEFFVASGCDRDDGIDELIELGAPVINESGDSAVMQFTGKTTLWDKVEYTFELRAEQIVYGYKVYGQGNLENVRYFEGFIKDDPAREKYFYPYFCGPGRHLAYHRPVKEFMASSTPDFDVLYTFCVTSADKRVFGFYEDASIRVNGDRHYFGGDWLATPAPFLFMMGNKEQKSWVTLGLAVKTGEAGFMGYHYRGGEGFGLELEYDGYTEVNGEWESPKVLMIESGEDVYDALDKHTAYLAENGCMAKKERKETPTWWKKPIFGGWGEQVYHSNRWDNYLGGDHDDWAKDNVDKFCTQAAYEEMLSTLESKGIDPTILIIDNRWFLNESHLEVDTDLWPDLKGFIADQHTKNRKVILWVSPWSYCKSAKGAALPVEEQMMVHEEELYSLELDTDVFYKACKREIKKVRNYHPLPEPTLTDPNWKYVADPQNPAYIKRVKDRIKYLLSEEGLNADGFEFDYTHFIPRFRATKPVGCEHEVKWGNEALHNMIELYYYGAKEAKEDALVISHTFNPYFNDVVDMLRLQDIYTDMKSIVPQMEHRAKIAQVVAPECAIHTDQHPMPSLEAWEEYAKFQPGIGNPCLYYVTGIETTKEKITDEQWKMLGDVWNKYCDAL